MADPYVSVTVDVREEDSELLQSLLHDLGALGLEVRDAEAPPMPGARPPARGEAIVIAFFDQAAEAQDALAEVKAAYPAARAALEEVPTQDWSNAWKALIRSVEVGKLWVGPPWQVEQAPAHKTRIVIEPKMAFGTGDHPTTSLCLAAVDRFLSEHRGASVLDVGTGTGVLAIAARKLGAGRVVGIDNDPLSVELAQENATANQTDGLELSGRTLEAISGTFDLVVANILANTLIALAPQIAAHCAERVVLAGVLVPQADDVEAAYVAEGLVPAGREVQGEWIRLELRRA